MPNNYVAGNKILKKDNNLMSIVADGKDYTDVEYPQNI